MNTRAPSDIARRMQQLRRFYYWNVALEFVGLWGLGMLWFAGAGPSVSLWWFILLTAPLFLVHQRFLNGRMKCPQCGQSLVDWDGIALHAKCCPHCGAAFK